MDLLLFVLLACAQSLPNLQEDLLLVFLSDLVQRRHQQPRRFQNQLMILVLVQVENHQEQSARVQFRKLHRIRELAQKVDRPGLNQFVRRLEELDREFKDRRMLDSHAIRRVFGQQRIQLQQRTQIQTRVTSASRLDRRKELAKIRQQKRVRNRDGCVDRRVVSSGCEQRNNGVLDNALLLVLDQRGVVQNGQQIARTERANRSATSSRCLSARRREQPGASWRNSSSRCSWSSAERRQTRSQADSKCAHPMLTKKAEANEFPKHAVVDDRSELLQNAVVVSFIRRDGVDFIERNRVADCLEPLLRFCHALLDDADLILPRLHEERANARRINLGQFVQRDRKLKLSHKESPNELKNHADDHIRLQITRPPDPNFVRMRCVHQLRDQASEPVPLLNDVLQEDLQVAVHAENVERMCGLAERIVGRNRVFGEIPHRGVQGEKIGGDDFGIAVDHIRDGVVLESKASRKQTISRMFDRNGHCRFKISISGLWIWRKSSHCESVMVPFPRIP